MEDLALVFFGVAHRGAIHVRGKDSVHPEVARKVVNVKMNSFSRPV